MTDNDERATVNRGPTPPPREEARDEAFDIAGNVREKGEAPSPSSRERGERSSADPEAPSDLDER